MSNIRLIPLRGAALSGVAYGRSHAGAANGFLDVPSDDAHVLSSNGFIEVGHVGPTSARSATPFTTERFMDTTLNITVIWNGSQWIDPSSGASV